MTKEHALNIMRQLQQVARGTLEEHKVIQLAIDYLSTLEEPKKEPKE